MTVNLVGILGTMGLVCGLQAGWSAADAAEPRVSIMKIQGAGHVSPWEGRDVRTQGVVTAVADKGFYLQDLDGDDDDATSDALFVFVGKRAEVSLGALLEVGGKVQEYVPGGDDTGNLSITQLRASSIKHVSADHALPAPVIVGRGGRLPPGTHILEVPPSRPPIDLRKDATDRDVRFAPDRQGLDFLESLESMRVRVASPVAVSPTRHFGSKAAEVYVLAEVGADVTPANSRTARGGLQLLNPSVHHGDRQPERLQLQFGSPLYPDELPRLKVGDRLSDAEGIVSYSFGNYEILADRAVDLDAAPLPRETTALVGDATAVTVASYNVENLGPGPEQNVKRAALARHLVHHLQRPDVVALQEIQDNSGVSDDGVTAADRTLSKLVESIVAAGGPSYEFVEVAPEDGAAGGIPGGNIRNAFLYNPQRVRLGEWFALDERRLREAGAETPQAFQGSRLPLLATFHFGNHRIQVINNHFTSRFGSSPTYGAIQPPREAGDRARKEQALALHGYVRSLVDRDQQSPVLVLGDLNTFPFTHELAVLLPSGSGIDAPPLLRNLIDRLDDGNAYTYNFEGLSQSLDHVFITAWHADNAELDIVHVNADYPALDELVASDHEPLLVRLRIPAD